MQSPQEQIGQAIADLKKLFPDKNASERADMVFANAYFISIAKNGTNGHK